MALGPLVMGIVNVTPDSFFPGSRTASRVDAVARGISFFEMGCDVVDVGGESTRPGADAVDEAEELSRVVPVVAELARRGTVSVDTKKASVARAAVGAGATIINDVSYTLLDLAGELGVGYVAMHSQGDSTTMQINPTYVDIVEEVGEFLRAAAARAAALGVAPLWLDPGIGFGKTREHNLALLAHCHDFVALAHEFGAEVLIGTSRKRFLGEMARSGAPALAVEERLEASIATEAWALVAGASIVRVHDVRAAVQLRDLISRPLEAVAA